MKRTLSSLVLAALLVVLGAVAANFPVMVSPRYKADATPAIYLAKGRQYIVVACGGGKLKTRSGDSYVAFALPGNK